MSILTSSAYRPFSYSVTVTCGGHFSIVNIYILINKLIN